MYWNNKAGGEKKNGMKRSKKRIVEWPTREKCCWIVFLFFPSLLRIYVVTYFFFHALIYDNEKAFVRFFETRVDKWESITTNELFISAILVELLFQSIILFESIISKTTFARKNFIAGFRIGFIKIQWTIRTMHKQNRTCNIFLVATIHNLINDISHLFEL